MDDIDRKAVEEILLETKRASERADTMGVSGWLKPVISNTNKRFLRQTLLDGNSHNSYKDRTTKYKADLLRETHRQDIKYRRDDRLGHRSNRSSDQQSSHRSKTSPDRKHNEPDNNPGYKRTLDISEHRQDQTTCYKYSDNTIEHRMRKPKTKNCNIILVSSSSSESEDDEDLRRKAHSFKEYRLCTNSTDERESTTRIRHDKDKRRIYSSSSDRDSEVNIHNRKKKRKVYTPDKDRYKKKKSHKHKKGNSK